MGCDMYLGSETKNAEAEFVSRFNFLINTLKSKVNADPTYELGFINQFLMHLRIAEGEYFDKLVRSPERGSWYPPEKEHE